MTPRTLLARMNERFNLLWSSAGRHDRQATLRAAFDWSWEMLSPSEMAALAQLSVFVGGFTLQTAQAVLDLSTTDAVLGVVDIFGLLVDKSFVRQLDGERFDLLESVREYAAEHLRTEGRYIGSGELAAKAAQMRHWRYFAALDEPAATAERCVELNNLVAACQRATARGDSVSAVCALVATWYALRLTGRFQLGVELASLVRRAVSLDAKQQAEVEWVAGSALDTLGNVAKASEHFVAGLALADRVGHRSCQVRLLLASASQQTSQGQLQDALTKLTLALRMADELRTPSLQCQVLFALGHLSDHQGDLEDAQRFYETALVIARDIGDRRLEGGLLGNLGGLHLDHGRLDEACKHYELALAFATQVGDSRWEGNARCNLGLAHHEQGHSAQARSEFEKSLAMALEVGHISLQCTVLCNLGIVLEAQDEFAQAREHYVNAVRLAHELGDRRLEGQFRGYLGLLDARLGNFGEARACLVAGELLLAEASDQLSLALLMCGRAEAECLEGNVAAASEWWLRAQTLAEQVPVGGSSELGRALARTQKKLDSLKLTDLHSSKLPQGVDDLRVH
jgi:tetratricopeptide (TPR) repeat protein